METRYWLDKDDFQWILKRDYPAKINGENGKPTGETRMATEVLGGRIIPAAVSVSTGPASRSRRSNI